MKNDLSYHNLSVEDATKQVQAGIGQTTLEVIGSKRSYTLNWCKPNNDDDVSACFLSFSLSITIT